MRMAKRVEILHEESMLRVASFRSVLMPIWKDAPDIAQVKAYARVAQQFGAQRPKATALLNSIIRGTPRFPEAVRDEVVKVMRMRGVFRLGVAHLITVGGLAGSATRAFMSTAILLGRPKVPSKVFGDATEACRWLGPRATTILDPFSPDELHEALVEALRGW